MILAIDPGKDNGYALWEDDGELVTFGQLTIDEMDDFLLSFDRPVSAVIVEDYRLFKKRAIQQSGSNMPASQVIGKAEMFAAMKGAKFIKQRADVLPIAQKLSQKKLPTDHSISHQFSAYNHGFYWMVQQGIVKPAIATEGR